MKRITFFIIVCIAGVIGAFITLIFSQNFACMVAAVAGIPGLALLIETWLRDRREINKQIETELLAREKALDQFSTFFNLDRKRAEILFLAGFKDINDFKNKSVEDLMKIEDINPTLANRIYNKMRDI